jgi:hypothetical protein
MAVKMYSRAMSLDDLTPEEREAVIAAPRQKIDNDRCGSRSRSLQNPFIDLRARHR